MFRINFFTTFSCLQNLQPGIQLLPRPHRDLRHIQSKVNQFNIYVFIQKLPFLVPCVSPYLHHLWWTTLKENWKRLLKRYLERSTYLSEDKWESTWTLTHSEKLSWLILRLNFKGYLQEGVGSARSLAPVRTLLRRDLEWWLLDPHTPTTMGPVGQDSGGLLDQNCREP